MVNKSNAQLEAENVQLKNSIRNLERRILTISKWIHLQFDPVPAEIQIVLQYKVYNDLHSRIKNFKSFGDGGPLPPRGSYKTGEPARELRRRTKKSKVSPEHGLSDPDCESWPNSSNSSENEVEESECDDFEAGPDSRDGDIDFYPEGDYYSDSDEENYNNLPNAFKIENKSEEESEEPEGDTYIEEQQHTTEWEIRKNKKRDSAESRTNIETKDKTATPKKPKKPKKRERDQNTQCHICQKVLATNKSLKHHLKTHSGEKPYLCNECGQSFIAQYYLTCHLRQHIPISERKKYECEICGSVQTNKAGFNRHKRRHAGLEQHQCPTCGIVFTGRSALRRHILGVHEKLRPHGCNLCDKSFKTKTHLKTHMRVHEGDKPSRGRALNKDSVEYKPRCRSKPKTQSEQVNNNNNNNEIVQQEQPGPVCQPYQGLGQGEGQTQLVFPFTVIDPLLATLY